MKRTEGDWWLGTIWWACLAGIVLAKFIEGDWVFLATFGVVIIGAVVYRRWRRER